MTNSTTSGDAPNSLGASTFSAHITEELRRFDEHLRDVRGLAAGTRSVIALWLGHESPVTTHHYVEADPAMKERALSRLHEPGAKILRYRASDSLLNFLRAL